jgi:hypothetical protein
MKLKIRPIPVAAPVELHRLTSGDWIGHCGECLAYSPSIEAPTDEDAWAQLLASGWTAFESPNHPGSSVYARCAKCSRLVGHSHRPGRSR